LRVRFDLNLITPTYLALIKNRYSLRVDLTESQLM
jgi:hypothetical protein